MTAEADEEVSDWGDGGPPDSETELDDVLSSADEAREEVARLASFVRAAVWIWSVIAGIWLYRHW